MCRKRGRVIQVGLTGLDLDREKFFRKEIKFQVSNSTGPGKGDRTYEKLGFDYPVGFVRWTGQRNFEAVLDMIAERKINVKPVITHRFPIEQASDAYSLICGNQSSLRVLLKYGSDQSAKSKLQEETIKLKYENQFLKPSRTPSIAFIGSGNYAKGELIPAFKRTNAHLYCISSNAGVSGTHAGKNLVESTTNTDQLFLDSKVDTIVIATRHDNHAEYVIKALEANKHVFCRKAISYPNV